MSANASPKSFIPPSRPLQFNVAPSSLESDAAHTVSAMSSLLDHLIKTDVHKATFANTILPFIEQENHHLRQVRLIRFYSSTSPIPELRETSRKATKVLEASDIDMFMRRDFYELVSAVRKRNEVQDAEYKYFLQKLGEDFERNGMGIEDPQARAQFCEIIKELSEKKLEGSRNLDGDKSGVWFTREELDGLPESFFTNRVTKENTEDDADPENRECQYWVSTKNPDVLPVQKFATKSETRKKMLIAHEHRAGGNTTIYRDILILRDEAARMLGFANHASFRTHYKAVKSPAAVLKFLNDVQESSNASKEQYIKTLFALKQESSPLGPKEQDAQHLFLWDRPFYGRIHRENACSVDQTSMMEYFPMEHCMLQMFKTFERLFGIKILHYTPKAEEVWHETVSMYTVWDTDDNAFLGWLYIDPYPREAKYQHFGSYGLQQGCTTISGQRLHPATALVCNFPKPTPTSPSLLVHEQLRRLFHELGHCMHNILSITKCARFHSSGLDDRDFAEAVGMMFENFLWMPEQMEAISCHYSYLSDDYLEAWKLANPGKEQPPRTLPQDLIQRLVESRNIGIAMDDAIKIWHSKFDMAIHTPETHDDMKNLDLQKLWIESRGNIAGTVGPEVEIDDEDLKWRWGHGFSSFRAVVSGYDAGYYTYLLSQIYSLDLFASGFADNERMEENGRRFRHIVLKAGGSKAADEIMHEFLGRDPDNKAFFKARGLE